MNNASEEKRRNSLRRFMKERGLQYKPWCGKAGISDGTLRAYLRKENPTNMTLANLAKLAAAANVSLSYMIGEEDTGSNLRDSDIAIIAILQKIFAVMMIRNILQEDEVKNLLNHQLQGFRVQNQSSAIEVTEKLLESLDLKKAEPHVQPLRKILLPNQD